MYSLDVQGLVEARPIQGLVEGPPSEARRRRKGSASEARRRRKGPASEARRRRKGPASETRRRKGPRSWRVPGGGEGSGPRSTSVNN